MQGRDPIIAAGQWETTIGGVHFVSRRKSTAVMVRARGFAQVAGQIEASESVTDQSTVTEKMKLQVSFAESLMRAAVVSPVIAPAGEQTIPGVQYAFEDLEAFADHWLVQFMRSGADVDPTPPSCEA